MKALKKAEKAKKVRTKSSKRLKKEKISSGAYIAPSLIGVLLFYILPFIVVIFYSLVDNPISKNFVFLENYQRVIKNSAFKTAVTNIFLKSADGSGGIHCINLAGTFPLQRCSK